MSTRREGYLIKQGGSYKNWKKRWFILSNELNVSQPDLLHYTLRYYKSKEKGEMKGRIALREVMKVARADKELKRPFALKLTTQPRVYFVLANSESEVTGWFDAIVRTMKEMVLTVPLSPSFAPELIFTPPASAGDAGSASAVSSGNVSPTMPRKNNDDLFGSSSNFSSLDFSTGPTVSSAIIKGWLQKKKEGKNWKKRYCALFPRSLAYYKSEPAPVAHTPLSTKSSTASTASTASASSLHSTTSASSLSVPSSASLVAPSSPTFAQEPKGSIRLDKTQSKFEDADKETKRPFSFKVTTGEAVFYFSAESAQEKEAWLANLNTLFDNDVPRGDTVFVFPTSSFGGSNDRINSAPTSPTSPTSSCLFGTELFGALQPAKCHATGSGVSQGFVGEPSVFTVHARDADGNLRVGRSDPFVVKINGPYGAKVPEPRLKGNSDGTYTVSYTCEEEGDYVVAVTVNGQHIVDSPFFAPHNYRVRKGASHLVSASPSDSSPLLSSSVESSSLSKDFLDYLAK